MHRALASSWLLVRQSVALGGVAYTIGVGILGLHWPTIIPGAIGPNELQHVAVLLGLGLHWRFVFRFAADQPDVNNFGVTTLRTDPKRGLTLWRRVEFIGISWPRRRGSDPFSDRF